MKEHLVKHIPQPSDFSFLSEKAVFVLADKNTHNLCYPKINTFLPNDHQTLILPESELCKTLEIVEHITEFLNHNLAKRSSYLICIGGGSLLDIGGFVASIYKRGIHSIYIPTTLLSQVDASIGGKTGINFNHLKNLIGSFYSPYKVLTYTSMLETLPNKHFVSGFSEMLKHALIANKLLWKTLSEYSKETIKNINIKDITESINIKKNIVKQDPKELHIRKSLNFGHTIGHAIETYTKHVTTHGEAIIIGMICETYLSFKQALISKHTLNTIKDVLISFSPKLSLSNHKELIRIMQHDKKNNTTEINFTLLLDIGKCSINNTCSEQDIIDSLGYYHIISQKNKH